MNKVKPTIEKTQNTTPVAKGTHRATPVTTEMVQVQVKSTGKILAMRRKEAEKQVRQNPTTYQILN